MSSAKMAFEEYFDQTKSTAICTQKKEQAAAVIWNITVNEFLPAKMETFHKSERVRTRSHARFISLREKLLNLANWYEIPFAKKYFIDNMQFALWNVRREKFCYFKSEKSTRLKSLWRLDRVLMSVGSFFSVSSNLLFFYATQNFCLTLNLQLETTAANKLPRVSQQFKMKLIYAIAECRSRC